MNRVDRLTAILLNLQERKISGDALARQFEVSRRTIMRDIQALCEMGIPVVAESGPSGGYSLMNFTMPPLPLTLPEAFLLQLGMEALEASSQPVSMAIRQSLRAKVRSIVPSPLRAEVDAMMATVETRTRSRTPEVPFFDAILLAIQDGGWVRVGYTSMERSSIQLLHPEKLFVQDGLWYLRAYSHDRGEERTYRMDRISEVSPAVAPQDEKQRSGRPTYGDPSLPEVVVELTRRGMLEAERVLSWAALRETESGGELRLRCPPDEYGWLGRVVLGLSREARAISPPEFVDVVRNSAQEIVNLYQVPENK